MIVDSSFFNETEGFELYSKIKQMNLSNASTDMYTCMAALSALNKSFMVQNNLVDLNKLNIQENILDDFVLIDTKTISDLELL